MVAGFSSAVDPRLPSDALVVAAEVRGPEGSVVFPAARVIAGALRRAGLRVYEGTVDSGREHDGLEADALAADAGAAWRLATAAETPPLTAVLAAHRSPMAEAAMAQAETVVAAAQAAVGPRTVLLAAPRASCAGVERAISTVEVALDRFGPPIYVRRQIVHNRHVVEELEGRGVRFVEEVDEVPEGAVVIFSAHGVSPAVRADAENHQLQVIDATCPLVGKVHGEARRLARDGYTIVLIGHADHEEVAGTRGEAPERIVIVGDVDEVAQLVVDDPTRVAYLTQTTLAVDETAEIVEALRTRFPAIVGPSTSDICYATQNRQNAVKAFADDCELVLVVGSTNSSNSRRLVELAERHGIPAQLIDDESAIDPAWLAAATTIGVTAGASAPERLVQRVVAALAAFGPTVVEERRTNHERVRFKMPIIA